MERIPQDSRPTQSVEPIAVIGLACELPGGIENTEDFWRALLDGRCTHRPFSAAFHNARRHQNHSSSSPAVPNGASYFDEVGAFDAGFFGVSPKEAKSIDPQQRLMLNVMWRALESAGIPVNRSRPTHGGVFVGMSSDDYLLLTFDSARSQPLEVYAGTGTHRSMASGRVAYTLGWTGPAIQIDTACSSSLVAVHIACQSLQNQDCVVALAGGVHLFLRFDNFVARGNLRALSGDGKCKPFSAGADGFGVGEGAGAVVLKRLSQARADHDRIRAVIIGSTVNHNGLSAGLTVPNPEAQATVMTSTLTRAQVDAADVAFLEAHGTGTALGDPIELAAIEQVYGRNRSSPIGIGSVKSNVGHTEAAAGVISLIKACLAVEKAVWPSSLTHGAQNPLFGRPEDGYRIATANCRWPATTRRIAGVSSFGMSGTNCHILVHDGEAPSGVAQLRDPVLIVFSARTPEALSTLAESYCSHVTHRITDLEQFAWTLAARRSHFSLRRAFVVSSIEKLVEDLQRASRRITSGDDNGRNRTPPRIQLQLTRASGPRGTLPVQLSSAQHDLITREVRHAINGFDVPKDVEYKELHRDMQCAFGWLNVLAIHEIAADDRYAKLLAKILTACAGALRQTPSSESNDRESVFALDLDCGSSAVASAQSTDSPPHALRTRFLNRIAELYLLGLDPVWEFVFERPRCPTEIPGYPLARLMPWIDDLGEQCYGPRR